MDDRVRVVKVELVKVRCRQCGHQWYIRRSKFPEVCPQCGSRCWNRSSKLNKPIEYNGDLYVPFCRVCGSRMVRSGKREGIQRLVCTGCGYQSYVGAHNVLMVRARREEVKIE